VYNMRHRLRVAFENEKIIIIALMEIKRRDRETVYRPNILLLFASRHNSAPYCVGAIYYNIKIRD